MEDKIEKAVRLIRQSDGILIAAGAGMGVDSGLPDFRGDSGLWKAYPALGRAQMQFHDIANPECFLDDPRLAWGFYGHRLQLYRDTVPHPGFSILQKIAATVINGAFVYTSNVDGQFQKSGFEESRILECHGSIHHLQCLHNCTSDIWPAHDLEIDVDVAACRLRSALPQCPNCGDLARPNILMFNDWGWLERLNERQQFFFDEWKSRVKRPVVVEIGAGIALPAIRRKAESFGTPLIRINPADCDVPADESVGLEMGALEALALILSELQSCNERA